MGSRLNKLRFAKIRWQPFGFDDTLNHVLTHSDNDVSHDVSQNKLLNSSTELVPCRDWH